jgi:hypothetical protein
MPDINLKDNGYPGIAAVDGCSTAIGTASPNSLLLAVVVLAVDDDVH